MAGRRFAGIRRVVPIAIALGLAVAGPLSAQTSSPGYEELVSLFVDWRAFQRPVRVDGVPDYTAEAMAAQHAGLAEYRRRLAAIDPGRWRIPEKVDYELVRAAFTEDEQVKLTLMVATINAWNRLGVGFRLAPPATESRAA